MGERILFDEIHGVVFALWSNNKIQLERARLKKDGLENLVLIPGGAVEDGQTLVGALTTEVFQEYGVVVSQFKKLGSVPNTEADGTLVVRHLYLITKWGGELSNPEMKSEHFEASLSDAFKICYHPLTQVFLRMINDAVI